MKNRLTSAALRGIFPAIPTPVTGEDRIDEAATRAQMALVLRGGANGVVPLGGTGEYGALRQEERVRMVRICAEAADGRIPVVAGVLDPGYYDALAAGRAFAEAGADALMVLTPYYTTPTQQGIRDYFVRMADEAPLPLMIYEIPYRTRVAIAPGILHELSRHPNIIGMKACNTDMYHFLQVQAGIDATSFTVFSGEDTLFPVQMAAGAKGGIVVTASALPRTWRRVYEACAAGRAQEALQLHRRLIPLLDLAFAETNPGPLKSVLDLVGVNAPRVLQPLVAPAPELRERMRAEMVRLLREEAAT
jgi:4-hydroxy-tetrahydrodipicolinate synthase